MIGYLKGRVVDRGEDGLILDAGGVGYELSCSVNTLDEISTRLSTDEVQLWVHTQLREDSLTLFGFATALEKRMFLSLLKVNGVGPKMAIKILSGASLKQLAAMIDGGDVGALSKIPKVGKKTAEQLILALKGKLVFGNDGTVAAKSAGSSLSPRFSGARADVLSALVNLGFRLQDAEQVVAALPEEVEIQQGIRQGLQALSGSF